MATAKFDLIRKYMLNAIDGENMSVDIESMNDKAKFQFVYKCFTAEKWCMKEDFNYYKNNERLAFKDWLMGLPSCFNIDFENHEILKLGKEFGLLRKNASEAKEDEFIDRWFGLITGQFYNALR